MVGADPFLSHSLVLSGDIASSLTRLLPSTNLHSSLHPVGAGATRWEESKHR